MYTYTLYDSGDSFSISKAYHIKCEIPPHRFRAIMMEFRRNKEIGENVGEFINFMKREFDEGFELFEYDDIVQYDADQENSMILANLLDQADQHI
ncbi:hypothetical protein CN326_03555 [Bacillus sp. AFS018417]|uniref:hypothetical protein n=1 Tax=Bacillus sp. AFS018417 TaxID=2033491 RepID=UPI000BF9DE2C|nr:hypothetical protein [Bacillus sp. AFS018417]PEZ09120.1 hypothetical protein CN326_03555 [Bacillus sp. AFS018417]